MKFPALKALGATFGYLSSHFLTLVKIMWLPVLVMMAMQAYFTPQVLDAQVAMLAIDPQAAEADPAALLAAMGPMLQATAIMYLISAIAYPMLIAGVLKHVVRGDAPRLPVYLSYGGDELRMLGAFILLIIMGGLIAVAGALGITVFGLLLSAIPEAVGQPLAALLRLIFLGVMIWFMLRMSVVFAAGVGERKIGISESWNLTEGNVLSLLIFWIVIILILSVISLVYAGVFMQDYLKLTFESFTVAADPEASREVQLKIIDSLRVLYDFSGPGGWFFIAMSYLLTMATTGMWLAASGVAYRYLTGQERG